MLNHNDFEQDECQTLIFPGYHIQVFGGNTTDIFNTAERHNL